MLTLVALGPDAVGGVAGSLGLFPETKVSSSLQKDGGIQGGTEKKLERGQVTVSVACKELASSGADS